MTRRLIPMALIFLAALVGAAYLFRNRMPDSLCDNLSCVQFRDKQQYTRSELYSDTSDTYRALYTGRNRYVRIEARKMDKTQADSEITASVTRMKALFEKAPAPYPGDISDAIVCDPAFVPVYKESDTGGNKISYFVGYLNDRLTFGSCSTDQATHRGITAFMYCAKSSTLVRMELIATTGDYNEHETAFTDTILHLTCAE